MTRSARLRQALAPVFVLAITLVPHPAPANPCGGDDQWADVHYGFGDGRRGATATESFERRIPAPRGMLRVDGGENGAVAVMGWDANEGFVCARIHSWAKSKAAASALAKQIQLITDERGIQAEGPDQEKDARWAVTYRIHVPFQTGLEVRTVNGPISVEQVEGKMDLASVNGPLALVEAGGDVRGRTVNGPLDVSLSGTRWSGRGLDLESTNGPVTVTIPERFSADLEIGTQNGPIDLGFPVTIEGRVGRTLKTSIGSGGPLIRIVTVNGPASLRRD
jgi:hypothetical protein